MHVALSIVDIIPQMLTLLSQRRNSFVYTCFNAQKWMGGRKSLTAPILRAPAVLKRKWNETGQLSPTFFLHTSFRTNPASSFPY